MSVSIQKVNEKYFILYGNNVNFNILKSCLKNLGIKSFLRKNDKVTGKTGVIIKDEFIFKSLEAIEQYEIENTLRTPGTIDNHIFKLKTKVQKSNEKLLKNLEKKEQYEKMKNENEKKREEKKKEDEKKEKMKKLKGHVENPTKSIHTNIAPQSFSMSKKKRKKNNTINNILNTYKHNKELDTKITAANTTKPVIVESQKPVSIHSSNSSTKRGRKKKQIGCIISKPVQHKKIKTPIQLPVKHEEIKTPIKEKVTTTPLKKTKKVEDKFSKILNHIKSKKEEINNIPTDVVVYNDIQSNTKNNSMQIVKQTSKHIDSALNKQLAVQSNTIVNNVVNGVTAVVENKLCNKMEKYMSRFLVNNVFGALESKLKHALDTSFENKFNELVNAKLLDINNNMLGELSDVKQLLLNLPQQIKEIDEEDEDSEDDFDVDDYLK
ncbi:hypothetical protein OAF54_03330 [bacterium]|nr:hypothetical protein [bacterium]